MVQLFLILEVARLRWHRITGSPVSHRQLRHGTMKALRNFLPRMKALSFIAHSRSGWSMLVSSVQINISASLISFHEEFGEICALNEAPAWNSFNCEMIFSFWYHTRMITDASVSSCVVQKFKKKTNIPATLLVRIEIWKAVWTRKALGCLMLLSVTDEISIAIKVSLRSTRTDNSGHRITAVWDEPRKYCPNGIHTTRSYIKGEESIHPGLWKITEEGGSM